MGDGGGVGTFYREGAGDVVAVSQAGAAVITGLKGTPNFREEDAECRIVWVGGIVVSVGAAAWSGGAVQLPDSSVVTPVRTSSPFSSTTPSDFTPQVK